MLRQLASSDPRFKNVRFQDGFNILVADKTRDSEETDSRNGAGKTSLVEILHFLLGMKNLSGSVLSHQELQENSFALEFTMPRDRASVRIERSLTKRTEVVLDWRGSNPDGPLRPGGTVRREEWVALLGEELFALPAEHKGITVRDLLGIYLRRVTKQGFGNPVKSFPMQSVAGASANVAYLLGLNWRLAARYQDLTTRETLRKKLKEAVDDPSFGLVVGSVSELRGQVAAAEQRVRELVAQVDAFAVVPGYEQLQAEADEIDATIRRLRLEDAADRRNLSDLEDAVAGEQEPDASYLEKAYQELDLSLPDEILRRYADVQEFHESVIANRRSYLMEELEETRLRLGLRAAEREKLGEVHARLLRDLQAGGALEGLAVLQEMLAKAHAAEALLKSRFETAKELEAAQGEIKLERHLVREETRRDLDEREETIKEINVLFQRFATALYGVGRDAHVEILAHAKSLKITPHIDGGDSPGGVSNMVMFCFDLTMAVLARRGGRGPDFLVHDSHLFDGVDARQVARAFDLAETICSEEDLQYVVTMNSDELEKAELEGKSFSSHVIEPRLTDAYEDGGIFGFRLDQGAGG